MIYFVLPIYVQDEENEAIQEEMLASLLLTTGQTESKLIVVDNGSKFGMREAQAHADYYVRTDEPIGYARAVNIGWSIVDQLDQKADIVVLNNDLTFQEGWLLPLIRTLDDPMVAGVAPYDFNVPADQVTNHIWSSCFAIRQQTRKEIGFFDADQLPYRYHDQDYWARAFSLGYNFKRIGASRVSHKESTTYKKMGKQAQEAQEEQIMQQRWGTTMAQTLAR